MPILAVALGCERVAYAWSNGSQAEPIQVHNEAHRPAAITVGPYVAVAEPYGDGRPEWNNDLKWAQWEELDAEGTASKAHCRGIGDLAAVDVGVLLALHGLKQAARHSAGPWDLRVVTRHAVTPSGRLALEAALRSAVIAQSANTVPEGVAAWYGCVHQHTEAARGRVTVALFGDRELGLFTFVDPESPFARRYDAVESISVKAAAAALQGVVGSDVDFEMTDDGWRIVSDALAGAGSSRRAEPVQLIGFRNQLPIVADFLPEVLSKRLEPSITQAVKIVAAVVSQDSPRTLFLCGPLAPIVATAIRVAKSCRGVDICVLGGRVEPLLALGACDATPQVAQQSAWMRSLCTPYAIGLLGSGKFVELTPGNAKFPVSAAVDWRPPFENQSEVSATIHKRDTHGTARLVEVSFGPVPAHAHADVLRLHVEWRPGYPPQFRAELSKAKLEIPLLRQVWYLENGQRRVPARALGQFQVI
jgi:hypothetical protein